VGDEDRGNADAPEYLAQIEQKLSLNALSSEPSGSSSRRSTG